MQFNQSYLTLCLICCSLFSCGGGSGGSGGDTPSTPAISSAPASSLAASTLSSSSSVSSTISSTQSSSRSSSVSSVTSLSSAASSLASHASNGNIYCTPAGTDPDGDGWGWENNASCVVRNGKVDPDKGNFQGCIVGTESFIYCTTDNGSWGFENNKICMSNSFCPANRGNTTQPALSNAPVDANASTITKTVYTYLKSIWGSKTLSGQQDLTWNDSVDMYQRVINDTGKAPALMGYDFMEYTRTGTGSGHAQTAEAQTHWTRGGLVTFCWHWRDPSRTTSEFYSDKMNFQIPIANGALDTSSDAFTKMETDLDTIAVQLKSLQSNGVTVLWRPLHEASGGWFWWGRSRTDGVPSAYAYVVLYRHIYDRLVNFHGLHNLIWVWNGQSAAWYPGDSYVDIVGTDIYDTAKNVGSQLTSYNVLKKFPLQTKLTALTENSNIPDPDNISTDGAWWLWFMVWNDSTTTEGTTDKNNFWTGEYYNTNAHKTKVYNHANVITLDELPKFTP